MKLRQISKQILNPTLNVKNKITQCGSLCETRYLLLLDNMRFGYIKCTFRISQESQSNQDQRE